MTTYAEADRLREERYAAILAENARLRREVAIQETRLQGVQAECRALELLPPTLHHEYLRKKELEREGFTVSADRVARGAVFKSTGGDHENVHSRRNKGDFRAAP